MTQVDVRRGGIGYAGVGCAMLALWFAGCDSGSTATLAQPDGSGSLVRTDGAVAGRDSGATAADAQTGSTDAAGGTSGQLRDASPTGGVGGSSDASRANVDVDVGVSPVDAAADSPQSYPDSGLGCGQTGAACTSTADCCGLDCTAGTCGVSACLSDGTACTAGGQCCSTLCGAGGTCTALNPSCKTAGNACTSDSDCCNHSCNANHQCASPGQVSFCAQVGDLCRGDSQCCTGVCSIAAGASAGTCATITTSCQVDGTLCNGCGSCCSHFCGPYGAAGPNICQPASGCHVQGDLCRKDSDCCGGDIVSALPGAGLIKCEPDALFPSRIGTCGGPKASNCPGGQATCKNACNPEGNVCHYKQTLVCGGNLTNLRNDCCGCISGKDCCQTDATGIPRCNALAACVPVGGNCSFAGDCCNHLPCLPNPTTGALTCGSACVQAGGACTTNADCCTGILCQATPGSVGGVCLIPQPPSPPDAGVGPDAVIAPDAVVGSEPDATLGPDVPLVCAYYGQACSTSITCCGGTSCVNGNNLPCADGDLDCLCFSPE